MTVPVPNPDLDLIVRAARRAGEAARRMQCSPGDMSVERKPDGTPVSAADLEANRILKDMLLSARPDHGWLSEESRDDPARLSREYAFVVDPIDGTEAFLEGRTDYVVSVALVRGGRPVAAALHQPAHDIVFAAAQGGGATRNGAPIAVRDQPALADGRLICPRRDLAPTRWHTPWPDTLHVGYRNAMAYRIALVAAGEWNGTLAMTGKNDWDLAAADLILTEAGGAITDLDGAILRYNGAATRKPGVACGAPRFHAALMRRLREWRQDESDDEHPL